jgi:hypothetical protein
MVSFHIHFNSLFAGHPAIQHNTITFKKVSVNKFVVLYPISLKFLYLSSVSCTVGVSTHAHLMIQGWVIRYNDYAKSWTASESWFCSRHGQKFLSARKRPDRISGDHSAETFPLSNKAAGAATLSTHLHVIRMLRKSAENISDLCVPTWPAHVQFDAFGFQFKAYLEFIWRKQNTFRILLGKHLGIRLREEREGAGRKS